MASHAVAAPAVEPGRRRAPAPPAPKPRPEDAWWVEPDPSRRPRRLSGPRHLLRAGATARRTRVLDGVDRVAAAVLRHRRLPPVASHLSARGGVAAADQVRPAGIAAGRRLAAGARVPRQLRRVSVLALVAARRDQRRRLRARDVSSCVSRPPRSSRDSCSPARRGATTSARSGSSKRSTQSRATYAGDRQLAVSEVHRLQAGVSGHQRGEQLLERSPSRPPKRDVSCPFLRCDFRVLLLLLAASRRLVVLLRRQLDAPGRLGQDGIPARRRSHHGGTVFLAADPARSVRSGHAPCRRRRELRPVSASSSNCCVPGSPSAIPRPMTQQFGT